EVGELGRLSCEQRLVHIWVLELCSDRSPLITSPSNINSVVDQTEPIVCDLMLEVVAILLPVFGDEINNLRSPTGDFNRVSFDVRYREAAFLNLVFEVDHK